LPIRCFDFLLEGLTKEVSWKASSLSFSNKITLTVILQLTRSVYLHHNGYLSEY